MAINKNKGVYVKTLLSWPCKALLERFSRLSGYSESYIIRTLVEINLPLEVDKYINKMEVINETSTQIQKS